MGKAAPFLERASFTLFPENTPRLSVQGFQGEQRQVFSLEQRREGTNSSYHRVLGLGMEKVVQSGGGERQRGDLGEVAK